MSHRFLYFAAGLTALVSLVHGQPTGALPRTADGHPDLSGSWANNIATPLQRPASLEGREFLTDEEVAAMRKTAADLFNGEGDAAFGDDVFNVVLDNVLGKRQGFTSNGGDTGDYSSIWTIDRVWDNRTALIIDPADGRMPAMTQEALDRRQATRRPRFPEGPEDRGLSERCITYGSPQVQAGYQSYYQMFQTPASVVLMTEMIHDSRVIRMDGSPHLPASFQQWHGDSRGHWEGDTLVVDTTNYLPRAFMSTSSEQLHVTERFSLRDADTLEYEVTIDDPGTWTRPWTFMIPWQRAPRPVIEYACHEGNYAMEGILAGARAAEAAEAAAAKQ